MGIGPTKPSFPVPTGGGHPSCLCVLYTTCEGNFVVAGNYKDRLTAIIVIMDANICIAVRAGMWGPARGMNKSPTDVTIHAMAYEDAGSFTLSGWTQTMA